MTVSQLIEKLSRLDPLAQVFTAHLLRDGTTLAKIRIVATADKDGEILLCDRDVVLALLSKDKN